MSLNRQTSFLAQPSPAGGHSRRKVFYRCLLAFLMATTVGQIPVQAIVFDAIEDTWIRESGPTAEFQDDLISVWPATSSDGARRNGAVMFDISSFNETITSAFLHLFDRSDSRSQTQPLTQHAFLIDPPNLSPYTWELYQTFDQGGQLALGGLGSYSIDAGDLVPGYQTSDLATAGDIAQLESRRTGTGLVTLILEASAGERDWGDIEFDGTPPRLVLNEDPPPPFVPGDWTGDGLVTIDDFNVMIDPANWLQEVEIGTRGDMNFSTITDLDDFFAFKPVFAAANGGTLSLPTPEPTGSILLLTGILGIVGTLRRRKETVT